MKFDFYNIYFKQQDNKHDNISLKKINNQKKIINDIKTKIIKR